LVCGAGDIQDRTWRDCANEPDYRDGRKNHLAWAQGVGSRVGGAADGSSAIGGRWTTGGGKKTPEIIADLTSLVEEFTGGDPMMERKWVRLSLSQLSLELAQGGHAVSPTTISRLLDESNYALRANVKSTEPGSNHPDRNIQFEYITQKKDEFQAVGLPVISVDTKKKELIGNFKNAGRVWCQEAEQVNGHDFASQSEGRAVPYGIYDLSRNSASVCVGRSADTPEFAVDAIARWWETEGAAAYPKADRLLILADAGGSNGARPRLWKKQLQKHLADRLGLTVTVCHYPTGCSKYNPIEHRLFSYISINWAGKPLRTFDTVLNFIRDTTTTTGLKVKAFLASFISQLTLFRRAGSQLLGHRHVANIVALIATMYSIKQD